MKKWIAAFLFLVILMSFAAAGAENIPNVIFREMATEEELASGSFRQIGDLPLQVWIPNEGITEAEIPAESGYEDAILVLIWQNNPANELVISSGTPDMPAKEFIEYLQGDAMKDRMLEVDFANVNGFPVVAYAMMDEAGNPVISYQYFVDELYVKISINIQGDDADNFETPATMISLSLEPAQ